MNLDIVLIERKPEDSGAYFRADSIDPLPKYRSTVLPQWTVADPCPVLRFQTKNRLPEDRPVLPLEKGRWYDRPEGPLISAWDEGIAFWSTSLTK